MAQAAHAHQSDYDHGSGNGGHEGGSHHSAMYYVKIWAILLGLLIISIMGPMLGNKVLTIITAFGIAVVKALIVAAFFMHLNIEKRLVWYLLFSMLAMVALFFFAVSPDVMKFDGRNWTKPASYQYVEDFKKAELEHDARLEKEEGHEAGAAAGGAAEGGEK